MKISTGRLYGASSILVLLALWEVFSLLTDSPQILPGPWTSLKATLLLLTDISFIKVVGATILRAVAGFTAALLSASFLGIIGGIHKCFDSFIRPWTIIMRSTPVIAFVLLALIWFKSGNVPMLIAFLTMFPIIYVNASEGIRATDEGLLEMAGLYKVSRTRLIFGIYLPSIRPFLTSAAATAMGIGWRAVIVGEVLSQPQWGIGTVMKSAQSYLQVEILIGWSIIAILLSTLFDKIIRLTSRWH